MYYLMLLVHVVVCVFLIIVVLLQSGKAADLAGAFGGMGSQTAFGPRRGQRVGRVGGNVLEGDAVRRRERGQVEMVADHERDVDAQ